MRPVGVPLLLVVKKNFLGFCPRVSAREGAKSRMLGTRDKALLAVMLGAQVLASRSGYGLPVFLVLAMISLVVFGTREKHPSEPSAFSVFNKGHQRLAGQFTAEQFDAQLRGTPNEPEQFMGKLCRNIIVGAKKCCFFSEFLSSTSHHRCPG